MIDFERLIAAWPSRCLLGAAILIATTFIIDSQGGLWWLLAIPALFAASVLFFAMPDP